MISSLQKSQSKTKIIFLGQVNSEEKDFLFNDASLTIIPSRREAMSIVALESALKKTPFMATDCCGLDSFNEINAGFSCEANSLSIKKNLNAILKNKKNLLTVGINAQKHVYSNYLWPGIISRINTSLCELMK